MVKAAAAVPDTAGQAAVNAALPPAFRKEPGQNVILENKDIRLQFSTRGAYPTSATLKDYKTYGGRPLDFFEGPGNVLSFTIPAGNAPAATSELSFVPQQQGPQKIDFAADLGGGKRIDLIYSLPAEGYMVQCDVRLNGIPANSLPLRWNVAAPHTERDINTERQNTQMHFKYKGGEHDYFTIKSDGVKKTPSESPLHWMGFRTEYFSSALIADEGFSRPELNAGFKAGDTTVLGQQTAVAELPIKGDGTGKHALVHRPQPLPDAQEL